MGANVLVCISAYVFGWVHWCPENNHSRMEKLKNQSELSLEAINVSDSVNSSEPSDSDTECCTEPCLPSRAVDGVSAKFS